MYSVADTWGLVESGKRHLKTLVRHPDQCAFRPSYGNIGAALLNKNNAPILLMSATCRPKAIEAIKINLKFVETDLDIIKGELIRPEIRIVRITMNNSLSSCLDLLRMYPSEKQTPENQLVPTLIYTGTRHATLKVLEVLDIARETPGHHLVSGSDFACRYHACTGKLDKQDCISDFAEGRVPLISCTLALGMGQNWRSVRQVVHIGRGDPLLICQMIGRAGRDGEPALAVLFVEKTRKNGKNSLGDFTGPVDSDEDRMDALALTPVCLRVAFKVDNL
jgi:ATP-dependent DNA helicase RecQ